MPGVLARAWRMAFRTPVLTGAASVCVCVLASCARPASVHNDSAAAATASATPHLDGGDVALAADGENSLGVEVRFLNAVPTLPSLIVMLSGGAPEIHTVPGMVTPYRPFTGRDIQVALVRGDEPKSLSPVRTDSTIPPNERSAVGKQIHASDTLAVRREVLTRGGRYTIIGMPSDDGEGVILRVVSDSILPDTSVAQVRLIQTAAQAGEFDLLLVGTNVAVFEGIAFANATRYQRLAPSMSQRLALRQDKHPERVITVPALQRLDAGSAYTIVVMGRRDSWNSVVVRDDVARAIASHKGPLPAPRNADAIDNR